MHDKIEPAKILLCIFEILFWQQVNSSSEIQKKRLSGRDTKIFYDIVSEYLDICVHDALNFGLLSFYKRVKFMSKIKL